MVRMNEVTRLYVHEQLNNEAIIEPIRNSIKNVQLIATLLIASAGEQFNGFHVKLKIYLVIKKTCVV